MEASIRLAAVDDAAAIARVQVDSWRTTYVGIVPDAHLASLSYPIRQAAWRHIIANRAQCTVVSEVDGAVVGFANGGRNRSTELDYDGELYAIYLLQSAQRGGLGRRLMQPIVARLQERRWRSMLVWVLADNPACRFYEALGGTRVAHKTILIGGRACEELAYGWATLDAFAVAAPERG